MDYKRIALYFAVALVAVLLYIKWEHDYPSAAANQTEQTLSQNQSRKNTQDFGPTAYSPTLDADKTKQSASIFSSQTVDETSNQQIQIKTDVLLASINTLGGNLVVTQLPAYPVSLEEKNTPVTLFTPEIPYVAESGLTTLKGALKPIPYRTTQFRYVLPDGHQELKVILNGEQNGIRITKTYLFYRASYAIKELIHITNTTSMIWKGSLYGQLVRKNVPIEQSMHSRSYIGGAMYTEDEPYKQLKYEDLSEINVSQDVKGGWVAFQQPYFLTAWIPQKEPTYHYYSHSQGDGKEGENNLFT